MTITAAGILFRNKGSVFLIRRSDTGEWATPGGKVEPGELPQDAARREVSEEVGFSYKLPITPYYVNSYDGGEFLTYLADKVEDFPTELSTREVDDCGWFAIDSLPTPMHSDTLAMLTGVPLTETDVAEAIVAGQMTSPQFFMNMYLWDIRVTGTGVTWRSQLSEFAFRNPDLYLNEEFLRRVPGVPVIWQHPDKSTLDHEEFAQRIVGTLTRGYIKDSDVWSIARIYDLAASVMMSTQVSTSPTVCLDPGKSDKIDFDADDVLLEDSPVLLDHVAICPVGVWDKQSDPSGVRSDSLKEVKPMAMTDEDKAEMKAFVKECMKECMPDMSKKADADEEKAKADAEEADAEEATKKAEEDKAQAEKDKAKAEAEKSEAEREKGKEADEKAKADAEEGARKDAEITALRDEMKELKSRMPVELSDADCEAVADAQSRADSVFMSFGQRAPTPLNGERAQAYRRRILGKLKQHSATFKDSDISGIADAATLDLVEKTVYADAEAASRSGDSSFSGLREVVRRDATGRNITEFRGDIAHTFAPFTAPTRTLVGIKN